MMMMMMIIIIIIVVLYLKKICIWIITDKYKNIIIQSDLTTLIILNPGSTSVFIIVIIIWALTLKDNLKSKKLKIK